jgi:hypothetical protein
MRVLGELLEMPADPVLAVGENSELAEASPQFAALWFELVVAIRPGVWPLQIVASGLKTFHLAADERAQQSSVFRIF